VRDEFGEEVVLFGDFFGGFGRVCHGCGCVGESGGVAVVEVEDI
jgi:hypothetical protein